MSMSDMEISEELNDVLNDIAKEIQKHKEREILNKLVHDVKTRIKNNGPKKWTGNPNTKAID